MSIKVTREFYFEFRLLSENQSDEFMSTKTESIGTIMGRNNPETPATDNTLFDPDWHDRVSCRTSYTTLARVHIVDDEEFVHNIILNRSREEYPDPYLRNVYDPSVLRRYWRRVKKATDNYVPVNSEEEQEIQEFREREHERVNEQLGYINYPTPDEYGFSTDAHWDIMQGADSKEPKILNWLYRMPLSHLRYLAGWFEVNQWSTDSKVFNSIRYVRGDPTVGFSDTLDVEDYAEKDTDNIHLEDTQGEKISVVSGTSIDVIVDEIDNAINKYAGFPVAVGLANMSNLSNMATEETSGGFATVNGSVNIQSFNVKWENGGESWNTIIHEFFHQIQFGLSLYDTRTNDNADWEITSDSTDIECDVSDYGFIPELMHRMINVWEDFCENPVHHLEDYQKKNMNEFYAVAFEAYHEEREELRKVQPEVYKIIDDLMK